MVAIFFIAPGATSVYLDHEQEKENIRIAQERVKAEKIAEDTVYLTGHFEPANREEFAIVPVEYTYGEKEIYLRKEALQAFIQMSESAKQDGIELFIASATRNFDYQSTLWNRKWTGYTLVEGKDLSKTIPDGITRFKKILEYSAAPSTSRHHWGTDIDINGANPAYFEYGRGAQEYAWLKENAPAFGFCQTYNKKDADRKTGYNEEKWHWSYLPLAQGFTQRYKEIIKNSDMSGFKGDAYVSEQDLMNDYVLGINKDCL